MNNEDGALLKAADIDREYDLSDVEFSRLLDGAKLEKVRGGCP